MSYVEMNLRVILGIQTKRVALRARENWLKEEKTLSIKNLRSEKRKGEIVPERNRATTSRVR